MDAKTPKCNVCAAKGKKKKTGDAGFFEKAKRCLTSYFVFMECWETRQDSQGNPSRVCLRCLYYEGRQSGRIETSRKCWEYQNCQMQCRYRSNPGSFAAPKSLPPQKRPVDPRERLLRTAAQLKTMTALRKPVQPKRPQNSEAAYKLIASILKVMLKESKK